METVACNLCGSENSKPLLRVKGWNIVQCSQCGLGYLNPRPDEEELNSLYEEEYFSRHVSDRPDLYLVDEAGIQERIAMQRARVAQIERLTQGSKGKLLDVGCATGFFLACARARGWGVQGLEISECAAEYARDRLQLDVWDGTPDDLTLPERLFDVITLYHTLEHLPDPLGSLKAIRQSLRKGGWLVIELPNFGSFDAKWCQSKWQGLCVPYHLYHFSSATITRMVTEAGFQTLTVRYEPSRVILDSLKKILGLSSNRPAAAIGYPPGNEGLKRFVRSCVGLFFTGRDMTVVARR